MSVLLPFLGAGIGAVVGSWAHHIAVNLLRGTPAFWTPVCSLCGQHLPWYYGVPLVNSAFFIEATECCEERPPYSGLLFEIIGIVSGFSLFVGYECSIAFFFTILVVGPLLVTMYTDWHECVIFDLVASDMLPIVGVASIVHMTLLPFYETVWGAVVALLFLWGVQEAYKQLRGVEGIGEGDVRLFTFIGASLGGVAIWGVLLLACVSALVYSVSMLILPKLLNRGHDGVQASASESWRHMKIPFGVFLAGSALAYLVLLAWVDLPY